MFFNKYQKLNQQLENELQITNQKVEELTNQIAVLENKLITDVQDAKKESHELIANVSHELRTPIAAILATTENIIDGVSKFDLLTAKQIFKYSEKMSDLVTFLLGLSKANAHKSTLEKQQIDASNFVEDCLEPLYMQDSQKNIQFNINVHPENLEICVDTKMFSRVISNIVSNAIRFSPQDGTIKIDVFDRGDNIQFRIIDQGPGIDSDDVDKIFERFHSGAISEDLDTNKVSGGTGIGLSIAKWVVNLHGGSIFVVNDNQNSQNTGAMFEIIIPKCPSSL